MIARRLEWGARGSGGRRSCAGEGVLGRELLGIGASDGGLPGDWGDWCGLLGVAGVAGMGPGGWPGCVGEGCGARMNGRGYRGDRRERRRAAGSLASGGE
ncbi:hypothetical protein GCM10023214_20620 [Amycolatopsis dongchuanensis]|uniref:Uncharacterized protein n=1 Tax=Amycolatopsis dongchuanensis TaxID=1070866 RepID=A0ABP9Q937_9PSEU